MATRTQNRQSNSTRSNRGSSRSGQSENRSSSQSRSSGESRSSESRSAFSWGENAGPLLGAALAGVAIGFAANYGRKAIMQGMEAAAGDWDKMLATDETQTFKRKMLLMKLTHALDKHAHQEEMVVYPALREANQTTDADQLEGE